MSYKLALKDSLNLKLIHKSPDTSVFIIGGVRKGTLRTRLNAIAILKVS
ncbi:hypothetical protein CGRA01v4_01979 [Colletotrichum graminicola]|nr:hypothetical protein CGRA01v4_01979 [Colletotrichum graminicola]